MGYFISRRPSGAGIPSGQVNQAFEPDNLGDEPGKRSTVTFTGVPATTKPFTPLKKKSSLLSLWSNDSRDQKLKSLKQELEMDEHKLPLATLFARYHTDPIAVNFSIHII